MCVCVSVCARDAACGECLILSDVQIRLTLQGAGAHEQGLGRGCAFAAACGRYLFLGDVYVRLKSLASRTHGQRTWARMCACGLFRSQCLVWVGF